jgi:hypothetical protein
MGLPSRRAGSDRQVAEDMIIQIPGEPGNIQARFIGTLSSQQPIKANLSRRERA